MWKSNAAVLREYHLKRFAKIRTSQAEKSMDKKAVAQIPRHRVVNSLAISGAPFDGTQFAIDARIVATITRSNCG